LFESVSVAAAHHVLHCVKCLAELLQLLQQLFAVGEKNVAPDSRIAGRDASEIPEAWARQRQEIARSRLPRNAVEVSESQQVRQVAHGSEGRVVVLGCHAQHLRADRRPDVGGLLDQAGFGLRQWGQDDLSALVQRGIGVLDASDFLAGNRVRRDEIRKRLFQHASSRIDDIALGRANIHQQHAGLDQVADRAEGRLTGRNRHRHQNDVRA
jgi:hypothetical protein